MNLVDKALTHAKPELVVSPEPNSLISVAESIIPAFAFRLINREDSETIAVVRKIADYHGDLPASVAMSDELHYLREQFSETIDKESDPTMDKRFDSMGMRVVLANNENLLSIAKVLRQVLPNPEDPHPLKTVDENIKMLELELDELTKNGRSRENTMNVNGLNV